MRDEQLAEAMLPHLERIEIAPGERLIEQGTPSADIFFIESGRAAVVLEDKEMVHVRVATVGSGSISIFTWPNCPLPPVCRMKRPSAFDGRRIVSL